MEKISGTNIKTIYTHTFAGKAFIYGYLENGTEIKVPEDTLFEMLQHFEFEGVMKSKYVYLTEPKIKEIINEKI
jgi:basic membrane lipoprotein Med (substrate-binding protein (PBP1-ABC) superfamily)